MTVSTLSCTHRYLCLHVNLQANSLTECFICFSLDNCTSPNNRFAPVHDATGQSFPSALEPLGRGPSISSCIVHNAGADIMPCELIPQPHNFPSMGSRWECPVNCWTVFSSRNSSIVNHQHKCQPTHQPNGDGGPTLAIMSSW